MPRLSTTMAKKATMLTFFAPSAEPTSPSIPGRFSTDTVSCFALGMWFIPPHLSKQVAEHGLSNRPAVCYYLTMARTVNATLYTVRRDAFLDVAHRLVQTKGYEAMSVQDVLHALEASKGAFYHYFDSKQALLEAVVERFADSAIADLAPVLNDPNLPALRKLERFFAGIARRKAEHKDLMLAII